MAAVPEGGVGLRGAPKAGDCACPGFSAQSSFPDLIWVGLLVLEATFQCVERFDRRRMPLPE